MIANLVVLSKLGSGAYPLKLSKNITQHLQYDTFQLDRTPIYENYSFCKWMIKKGRTVHFQFHLLNQKNQYQRFVWLLEAEKAKELGVVIDRNWVYDNYGVKMAEQVLLSAYCIIPK